MDHNPNYKKGCLVLDRCRDHVQYPYKPRPTAAEATEMRPKMRKTPLYHRTRPLGYGGCWRKCQSRCSKTTRHEAVQTRAEVAGNMPLSEIAALPLQPRLDR